MSLGYSYNVTERNSGINLIPQDTLSDNTLAYIRKQEAIASSSSSDSGSTNRGLRRCFQMRYVGTTH